MIKRLLRMGSLQLHHESKLVESFDTPYLYQLVEDLFDTMRANGGVGIAAPQVGIPLQVIVFGFETSLRYPHAAKVPETVLINPSYSPMSDEVNDDWEGCLSVKGLRGLTRRYTHISYQGQDIKGNKIQRNVSGFHARLVQHEIDHLSGCLFLEKIENIKNFGFEEELTEVMRRTGSKLK